MSTTARKRPALLALADGKIFHGTAVGYEGETSGEVVFNTSMTGYQEILSDPSYTRQILTFTYPHIGNVGANAEDVESDKVQVSGIIVRDLSAHASSYRAQESFSDYLVRNKVVGISGIDTRELVLHLREHGAQLGIISSSGESGDTLVDRARALPSMEGLDLVREVSSIKAYEWKQTTWAPGVGYRSISDEELKKRPLCVAVDYGVKYNILRLLVAHGFRVVVVPATSSAEDILALSPDAVFLSNGPGDPAAVHYAIEATKGLIGKKPLFGICLGHQILGLAMGAPTFKLKFGHRGGNHPVRNVLTGKVEITVQNHGFATDLPRVPKHITVSHMNLNDHTVEGLVVQDAGAFSVQYHPESSPGPRDAQYLFQQFREMVK